jgi:hypothetical protein
MSPQSRVADFTPNDNRVVSEIDSQNLNHRGMPESAIEAAST